MAHRGHATSFLSRDKIKISENYRAINEKHARSRNRLSRTLFPWTTMAATIEEVCFEVNRNKMATAKRKKLLAAEFIVISETRRIR